MLDEQHSHVRDAMDSIRGKTVMDVEHFFYCIFFCWRRVSISFKSLIVFETRPISIKLLFVGHRYGMSKLALFDLRVFFFLWVSGSAYTFSGIFFSVNQILFTNKTNYFQSLALLYGNVPLIQHSILIGHEHNVQMFQTETTNHISYSSFRLIPAMIEFAMHSTATMRFSRKLDNICSPMNCWSIYFRSKFSILLLLIAFTTHNFFCLAECSFAVLLFAAITQTSLFALALARSLLFPFPVNKNTELSFVTTNGSTNSI